MLKLFLKNLINKGIYHLLKNIYFHQLIKIILIVDLYLEIIAVGKVHDC